MSYVDKLPKPFFVLAPMDDVTDTVFRQFIASISAPDLFFTEFVNVDALQSKGREATLPRLRYTQAEKPLIAQIWGKDPEHFYKTARELADGTLTKATMSNGNGYDGVDLNFGCPDKNVVRNGTCSALILPENRARALEIIQATREGANYGKNPLPVSVKTRLGFSDIDYTWHELLLNQKLNALSIHGRTKSQMSKVPANWDAIGEIVKLRDKLSPTTLMIGNGDVMSRTQGDQLANKYKLDGIMIGRGVFNDPFVFAKTPGGESPWEGMEKTAKIKLYADHVKLFASTWQNNERKIHTLNKFCKIYIQGFEGAKELREELMSANTTDDLLTILQNEQH